jgi:hypothetical protein
MICMKLLRHELLSLTQQEKTPTQQHQLPHQHPQRRRLSSSHLLLLNYPVSTGEEQWCSSRLWSC